LEIQIPKRAFFLAGFLLPILSIAFTVVPIRPELQNCSTFGPITQQWSFGSCWSRTLQAGCFLSPNQQLQIK